MRDDSVVLMIIIFLRLHDDNRLNKSPDGFCDLIPTWEPLLPTQLLLHRRGYCT